MGNKDQRIGGYQTFFAFMKQIVTENNTNYKDELDPKYCTYVAKTKTNNHKQNHTWNQHLS